MITVQPTSQSVYSDTRVTLSTAATGNPRPRVQWQVSTNGGATWEKVAGATSASWTFTPKAVIFGYRYREYRAAFTNVAGSVRSLAATITISPASGPGVTKGSTGASATPAAPTITTQPASQAVAAGAVVTFRASAAGNPTPVVQWEVSANGGDTWANVAGANTRNYTLLAGVGENGFLYRAVFANSRGGAVSAAATLTISEAPTVTTQPASQTAFAGNEVAFEAAATGLPVPTIAWQLSTDGGVTWTAVAGATEFELVVASTSADNGNDYRAVFTSTAGSATTNAATLTVAPAYGATWSGYAIRGSDFTSVSASWVVPAVSCAPGENSIAVQWVGIDGWGNATVEQDGTGSDCANGVPNYYAWWELYGDPAVNDGAAIPLPHAVFAGDQITASVALTGSTWTLTVADITRNWSIATPEPLSSPLQQQTTAEWIVEDPGGGAPAGVTLSAFSPTTFTNATATANGVATPLGLSPYVGMQMQTSSTVLAFPGPVTNNSFTVTYG